MIDRRPFIATATIALILLVACLPARALRATTSDVGLVPVRQVAQAIIDCKAATVSAYVLSPTSSVAQAMIAARHRGADIVLVLDQNAYPEASAEANRTTTRIMQRAGISVLASRENLHLKAALIDHKMVYLSDRNFSDRGGLVLKSTDAGDYEAVAGALSGQHAGSANLRTLKSESLEQEATLIRHGSGNLYVESESFGYSVVYQAMLTRAQNGDRVQLVVAQREYDQSPSERSLIADLIRAGVRVRVGATNEKVAVNSDEAWVGSANASGGQPQADWGFTSDDPHFIAEVRSLYLADFEAAHVP